MIGLTTRCEGLPGVDVAGDRTSRNGRCTGGSPMSVSADCRRLASPPGVSTRGAARGACERDLPALGAGRGPAICSPEHQVRPGHDPSWPVSRRQDLEAFHEDARSQILPSGRFARSSGWGFNELRAERDGQEPLRRRWPGDRWQPSPGTPSSRSPRWCAATVPDVRWERRSPAIRADLVIIDDVGIAGLLGGGRGAVSGRRRRL